MKKLVLVASAILFSAVQSCDKKEGRKSVIAAENASDTNRDEKTERYVAEDGSSALVTVRDNEDDKSISIRSNNKTITAPWKSEGVYSNYDFEIMTKNDSVKITQGDNVITLKKARGQ